MTPERSASYTQVIRTLDDMGPAKLHDLERQRIRNAADTLLFASADDPAAFDALADVVVLARHLSESGRWSEERAERLTDDVAGCGPSVADVPVIERAA